MKQIYFFLMTIFSFSLVAQVTQIKDINSGTASSSPTNLTVFNNQIYFAADDASGSNTGGTDYGRELWVSDGTEVNTSLVLDINSGDSSGAPFAFFELNNKLYFSANDGNGSRIWETDGTEVGTLNTNNGFSFLQPIVVNDIAYMTATTEGNTFYQFDGTTSSVVPDTGSGVATVIGGNYVKLNDTSIIAYLDYVEDPVVVDYGIELYLYDITNESYTLLKDILAGDGNSGISNFTALGDKVYFEALNALWVTDGTSGGSLAVSVANTIEGVNNLYAWNDKLFFKGNDGTGNQLWVYDPALDTVTNISNIGGDNATHDPSDYAEFNGYLYYRGEDANDSNGHLFKTDGTTIEQLDDVVIDIDEIVVLNNKLYFEGDNGNGNELFSYDTGILSVNSVAFDNALTMYPNPSENYINIKGDFNNTVSYIFYNVLGEKIASGNVLNDRINHNLNAGIYYLNVTNEGKSTTRKIVVK